MKRNREIAYSRALVPKKMSLLKKIIIGLVMFTIVIIIIATVFIKW